jgi:oligoendopeptidase F
MKAARLAALSLVVLTLALSLAAPAAAVERTTIDEKYKWNVTDIYPSDDAWRAAKDELGRRIPELARFQGKLGESPAMLYDALAARVEVDRVLARLAVYATLRADEDTRSQAYMAMDQEVDKLGVDYGAVTAYLRPEVLALGPEKVKGFVAADPRLAPYAIVLDEIVRWAPHTLSPAEERIVAKTDDLAGAGASVRGVFSNAELPFPTVTLSTGDSLRLDPATFGRSRALPERADRLKVFRSYFGTYQRFAGTYGTMLNAHVKSHVFEKEVRKFDSCLEAALFGSNIPPEVYHQLLRDVHANLPTLHRYLKLRQRMMGLDTLRYEDLYAPIVKKVDLKFTPEQTQELVVAAVAPLGPDYQAVLRRAFVERWVDWMPSTGKRSGAYSTGIYDVHPYQLLNFTGLYDDVSTVAHEGGHGMHSYYSSKGQPYPTWRYRTFVAEVASTLNEALLLDYMLGRTPDRETRLVLLGSRLEDLRQTLFRQVLFAEFELKAHEMLERGEPLTGEKLTQLYLGLLKDYYGDAAGVCKVDDLYGIEWAQVPHFYRQFYVYQYATSIVASSSLAKGILAESKGKPGKAPHRDAYLKLLAAGGSKYPIDLLKDAGVDMTTSAPFTAAMAEMNAVMDEMEKLLK